MPLGALIWYNNSTDIQYNSDLDTLMKVIFCTSFGLTLIEIVIYHCAKVHGIDYEVDKRTKRPLLHSTVVKIFGIITILLTVGAIVIGTQAFNEKYCKDIDWFIDDDVVCKDCKVLFGDECLLCTNTTSCGVCDYGYFWATANDTSVGIVAENETRCRSCASYHGELCLECTQATC